MRASKTPKYFLLFTFYFLLLPYASFDREHPHRASIRYLGILAGKRPVQACLHRARIDAETRLHSDVLHAIDRIGHRNADDAGAGRLLPEHLPVFRIERPEHPIVGPAREYEAASGCENRTPVG